MSSTLFATGTLIPSAWLNDVDTGTYTYLTGTAGTNTITATGPTSMTAYAAGQKFFFIPVNNNTGNTTLNINGLGAKTLKMFGLNLLGGELQASTPVCAFYDGTNMQIIGSTAPNAVSGTFTPAIQFGGASTGVTYTSRSGYYTRIGNLVMLEFILTLSSKGSSVGNASIVGDGTSYPPVLTNLANGITGSTVGFLPTNIVFNSMTTSLVGMIGRLSSSALLLQGLTAAGTSYTNLTDTAFSNTTQLLGTTMYHILG